MKFAASLPLSENGIADLMHFSYIFSLYISSFLLFSFAADAVE